MRVKLDTALCIEEICKITKAKYKRKTDKIKYIDTVCTDTRECQKNDLFIAVKGEKDSGEKYVLDALKKGCCVLSSSGADGTLFVNDTSEALLKIAELYKKKISPKHTVAVTGSVGKSTVVRFISTILSTKYKLHSPYGNYNNHIGVPLTVLSMPRDTEVLVLELGMNRKNEISKLSKCSHPDLGVITAIGTSHIGNLGSREAIALAKLEILDGMKQGKLLLPYGEPLLNKIKCALFVGCNSSLSDFSLNNNPDGSYRFKSRDMDLDGIEFFDSREHMVYNLAFSISTAQMLGLSKQDILKGVKAITASNLRQRFILLKSFTIFDDSYNASRESILADLKYISSLKRPTGAFLGDILELGDNTEYIHEEIGRMAADLKIDHLYLYGEYAEYTARGAVKAGMNSASIYINSNLSSPETSISHIKQHHSDNEIILFKASHKLRLDKIADLIEKDERNNNE